MIVYKITNTVNGKVYIGQTTILLKYRFSQHASKKSNSLISRAIRKYGVDKFTVEEIDFANTHEELNEREQYWISFYASLIPDGYNLSTGGFGKTGVRPSPVSRLRMSIAKTGHRGNPGKVGVPRPRHFVEKAAESRVLYYIQTPDGVFPSRRSASEFYGIHPDTVSYRVKSESCKGWFYIPKIRSLNARRTNQVYLQQVVSVPIWLLL